MNYKILIIVQIPSQCFIKIHFTVVHISQVPFPKYSIRTFVINNLGNSTGGVFDVIVKYQTCLQGLYLIQLDC